MYKLFPGKTPTQMRIEAQQERRNESPAPLGQVDPSQRPRLHYSDSDDQIDATREWLAHIAAGRIEVK